MEPVLIFDSVSFAYHCVTGETKAVSNLSFQIYPGEFVVLVGPSGCGKSTLLSLACGLISPEQGEVKLCTSKEKGISFSSGQIGYMFQKDHLFEWRSLYRNTLLGPELKGQCSNAVKASVKKLIDSYGLSEFINSPPSALSGGMRQRAALIRTLAVEPQLLLLDEPFSALDYQTRLEVADDITSLIRKTGKTVLMVTHDLSEAVSVADRILILSSRPCTLKSEIIMDFPDSVQLPFQRRQHPHFSELFNRVWKELKYDEND